eukprot:5123806-Pleurochrysis_carterae.AAC.3
MASAVQPGTLHVVFTSECNNAQFDWFTVGVYESFRKLNIRGNITRLLACNEEDLPRYKGLNLGPTFVHPNYRHAVHAARAHVLGAQPHLLHKGLRAPVDALQPCWWR